MPTSTTEGIILKRSNYGEADRIITVMTPYKGKIRLIAKGVRRITSRRAGNVEPLNRVRLHLYIGKDLNILTEAESIETFSGVKSNLTLSAYASHVIELIDRLIPEESLNPESYKLLLTVLTLMERSPRQLWIRAFEVKLLSTLGFWSENQIETSSSTKDLLRRLEAQSWEDLSELTVTNEQALELERVLRYYIERILESPLKSLKVIEKLKD